MHFTGIRRVRDRVFVVERVYLGVFQYSGQRPCDKPSIDKIITGYENCDAFCFKMFVGKPSGLVPKDVSRYLRML